MTRSLSIYAILLIKTGEVTVTLASSPEDAADWCEGYVEGDKYEVRTYIPLEGVGDVRGNREISVASLIDPLLDLSAVLGDGEMNALDLLIKLVQATFEAGRFYEDGYGHLHKKN